MLTVATGWSSFLNNSQSKVAFSTRNYHSILGWLNYSWDVTCINQFTDIIPYKSSITEYTTISLPRMRVEPWVNRILKTTNLLKRNVRLMLLLPQNISEVLQLLQLSVTMRLTPKLRSMKPKIRTHQNQKNASALQSHRKENHRNIYVAKQAATGSMVLHGVLTLSTWPAYWTLICQHRLDRIHTVSVELPAQVVRACRCRLLFPRINGGKTRLSDVCLVRSAMKSCSAELKKSKLLGDAKSRHTNLIWSKSKRSGTGCKTHCGV